MTVKPIFVYGTLMTGNRLSQYVAHATSARRAATIGDLYDLPCRGYPAVVAGDGFLRGELLEFAPDDYQETLDTLDMVEGYRPDHEWSLYERVLTDVEVDGEVVEAWIYRMKEVPEDGVYVPEGDWNAYRHAEAEGV